MTLRRSPRVRYRSRPEASDVARLRKLVDRTRVFYREERAIALELLEQRLSLGAKSGYWFFFAEHGDELVGYCAWGNVPLTKQSYDLYWIAVDPDYQGQGIGQRLMALAEHGVARRGGGGLYIETSSRPVYARTRRFYRDAGYRQVARLADFYAPQDHKILFRKVIRSIGNRGVRGERA